jgi:hypothetical protein
MVRDEVQSTVSNGTDQTMITLFRDEMAANRDEMAKTRLETKNHFELIQQQMQQMNQFQTFLAGLIPQLENKNIQSPTTNNDNPTTDDHRQPKTSPDLQLRRLSREQS